jgi:hypothetical protein
MPGSGGEINSLMDLMQPGKTPQDYYSGKTLGDIMDPNWTGGAGGAPADVGGFDPQLFASQVAANRGAPATPENLSWAMNYGNLRPATMSVEQGGSPLLSSGPEGGYFPGDPQFGGHGQNPAAYYGQGWGSPPPPNLNLPSTNNWRLLPGGYNKPGFAMRAGHVINIDAARQGAPYGLVDAYNQTKPMWPVYSGRNYGAGYPAARAGYGFFPGQVEIDTMRNYFGNYGSAT